MCNDSLIELCVNKCRYGLSAPEEAAEATGTGTGPEEEDGEGATAGGPGRRHLSAKERKVMKKQVSDRSMRLLNGQTSKQGWQTHAMHVQLVLSLRDTCCNACHVTNDTNCATLSSNTAMASYKCKRGFVNLPW